MTKNRLILIICLLIGFTSHATDTLKLSDAISKKQILATITGNDPIPKGSTMHYGLCIKAKLKNLTDKPIIVQLQAGRILKSSDKNIQNMVISKTQHITVPPKKEVSTGIYALCAEMSKSAPTPQAQFTVGDMCNEPLQKAVDEIVKLNAQNMMGQYGVWCITDNAAVSDLTFYCTDKTKATPLVKLICGIQKVPVPKEYSTGHISQRLNISYNLKDSAKVKILLYDKAGNMKLNILNPIKKGPGAYNDSYWISDADILPGEYEYIIFINGEPQVTENFTF
ncbi:MAG: hypothetical protein V4613_01180 [Bacteroidota bacterium]